MNRQSKFLITVTILTAIKTLDATAHTEPKESNNIEKCYGVAKAYKNDCANKIEQHSCAGQSKIDGSPNDWIKVPQGLCDKLVGGIIKPDVN